MSETKHTPLPWNLTRDGQSARLEKGDGPVNRRVVIASWTNATGDQLANAEFVLRACNSYYELLEALINLVDLYDTDEGCRSLPQYQSARAAIAKAKGEIR